MDLGLKDKVALVTGSSRGIGRATAICFAKEGAKVVINYVSQKQAAEEAAAIVEEGGGQALIIKADISKQAEVQGMVETIVNEWGSLDILVNNAIQRILEPGEPIEEMDFDRWRVYDEIALWGTFYITSACVPHMKKRAWGRIVNLAGLFSHGAANVADHCVVPAAKIAIAKALAKELAPFGILVNSVSPGLVLTEAVKEFAPDEIKQLWAQNSPLGRLLEMDEVARLIVFLCSEVNTAVNGEVVEICGGRTDWF
ncbi:SDR family NAD(P)-dependent oxidoreductase [Thermodesulfobacteriota bacterium]